MKRRLLVLAAAAAIVLSGATAAVADLDCVWTRQSNGSTYGRCVTEDRQNICWICNSQQQNCRQVPCS